MVAPWDRNMWLYAYLIYKVVFCGYLFIPYCIVYYTGIRLGLGENIEEPQLRQTVFWSAAEIITSQIQIESGPT
jgi:hypothetical protein